MMKVKKIGSDSKPIEAMLNEFFEEHYITKDQLVKIHMDCKPEYVNCYVFYDYGEDDER